MPASPNRTTPLVLAMIVLVGTAAGCRSRGEVERVPGMPDTIHAQARKDLRNHNFDNAVVRLEALEARYPFSEEAKQAAEMVVSIAQFGSTRSINAGVAAGIVMHAGGRDHADLSRAW